MPSVAAALTCFERTLVFDDSPLDRYMDGNTAALDAAQQRGLALFLGKARCIQCHLGPNLTDNQFHDLAVPDQAIVDNPKILAAIRFDAQRMGLPDWAQRTRDPGRELVSKNPADRGKFRTMGLRNIESSPPYMHNGRWRRLPTWSRYDRGGGDDPQKPAAYTARAGRRSRDLLAFLRALTGTASPATE
jgi:cytochrome c peroxidase